METLGGKSKKKTVVRSSNAVRKKKKKVVRSSNASFPAEIIDEILTRLPVKSILRFRSVSKQWRSRISDPSFTQLHFNRTTTDNRTALLFSAYDSSTRKLHFLSGAHDGGPVTHLMTLDHLYDFSFMNDVEHLIHLNGFVCLICSFIARRSLVFVLNPSTRKIFKLPDPTNRKKYEHLGYLFGYDDFRNEHKIVHIKKVKKSSTVKIMIFSMSNYSWRKINVDGFSNWDRLSCDLNGGVCVNSVVYVMLQDLSYDILAFDLKTEKLSIISIPQYVLSSHMLESWFMERQRPRIMKINGCLGVVFYCGEYNGVYNEVDVWMKYHEVDIWTLQDYENHVWVRETNKFRKARIQYALSYPIPQDVNVEGEIIFSLIKSKGKGSENVKIMPIFNTKSGCFKFVRFTLDHPFLCSKTMGFNSIQSYVESIIPL